jgi:alkaline phosphatase
MGGGRKNFMPVTQRDPEEDDKVGERLDGRDLIADWKQRHAGGVYVWNKAQLDAAPLDKPLLGCSNTTTCSSNTNARRTRQANRRWRT